MHPMNKTFHSASNSTVPGMIDALNNRNKLTRIPSQLIRNLVVCDNYRTAFVLLSTSDGASDRYVLDIPFPVLKQIYKAALTGQDFDLTKYSGDKAKRLIKFEDLPEVQEMLEPKQKSSPTIKIAKKTR